MIDRIEKSAIKLELDDDVAKYIDRKIGRLDRYLPRGARKTAHAIVTLRETGNQDGNKYECEVVLRLPGETVTAKEATLNKFAAVDIVEAKLKNQLRRYKDARTSRRLWRRVRERLLTGPSQAGS